MHVQQQLPVKSLEFTGETVSAVMVQAFRLSRPWIRLESIFAISSNLVRNSECLNGVMKPRRKATSSSGMHSCVDPRAMVKKLVHPANEYLQREKGHYLSGVKSPCGDY